MPTLDDVGAYVHTDELITMAKYVLLMGDIHLWRFLLRLGSDPGLGRGLERYLAKQEHIHLHMLGCLDQLMRHCC